MEVTLTARGVWREFARDGELLVALKDISLTINRGEFATIVGPSGCGKSTFLNLVAGFLSASRGQLMLDQKAITGPGADRGMVFQEHALFPWMSVTQNIEYGMRIRRLSKRERRQNSQYYLSLIGLTGFANAFPKELSGGMKQRVAIARALACEPKMLLMDEPFAALDAQTRRFLQDELVRIWLETKATILFITHNIDEAILLSDRVFVMTSRPGQLKKCIDIRLDRPRSETDAAFVAHKTEIIDLLKFEIEQSLRQSGELSDHRNVAKPSQRKEEEETRCAG